MNKSEGAQMPLIAGECCGISSEFRLARTIFAPLLLERIPVVQWCRGGSASVVRRWLDRMELEWPVVREQ